MADEPKAPETQQVPAVQAAPTQATPPAATPPVAQPQAAQASPLAPEIPMLQDRLVRAELKAAAISQGIVDLSLLDHLPTYGAKVGADGTVAGVTEALAALRSKHPALFKPAPPPGQPAAPAPIASAGAAPAAIPSGSPPPVTDVRALTRADYARTIATRRMELNGGAPPPRFDPSKAPQLAPVQARP